MDMMREEVLHTRDIKQIKLSLIKSFTKNVQTGSPTLGEQDQKFNCDGRIDPKHAHG